jgi:hypothetical protein
MDAKRWTSLSTPHIPLRFRQPGRVVFRQAGIVAVEERDRRAPATELRIGQMGDAPLPIDVLRR